MSDRPHPATETPAVSSALNPIIRPASCYKYGLLRRVFSHAGVRCGGSYAETTPFAFLSSACTWLKRHSDWLTLGGPADQRFTAGKIGVSPSSAHCALSNRPRAPGRYLKSGFS